MSTPAPLKRLAKLIERRCGLVLGSDIADADDLARRVEVACRNRRDGRVRGGRRLRLSHAWDASQHPRGQPENAGQFTTKGAGGAAARNYDALPPKAALIARRVGAAINATTDSPRAHRAVHRYHVRAVSRVLGRMPAAAHERISRHLGGVFVGSQEELWQAVIDDHAPYLAGRDPKAADNFAASIRSATGPMYSVVTRKLYVLSQFHADEYASGADAAEHGVRSLSGVYAHELMHAADGPRSELSNSAPWQAAYQAEIEAPDGAPTLTNYASTHPAEGFAEFGRLLFASEVPLETVAAKFPRCATFFKEHDLWPE